jgi:hypothetical protein
VVFFITHFDRDVRTLSRLSPREKNSLEFLVRLRWVMKNALGPVLPFG